MTAAGMLSSVRARGNWGFFVPGVMLLLVGIFMPQDWYAALPRNPDVPTPPVSGLTLFQLAFVLEGLALMALSLTRWRFTQIVPAILPFRGPDNGRDEIGPGQAIWALAAVTILALALRLIQLNSDLWLDEITTVMDYSRLPLLQVFGGYLNFNNHLLNTLLIKLSAGIFGESEWAIRLPVVFFGTAAMPVVYWISRQLGLSRFTSLGVALLLAVSYQHIFFSQNARGYIGHVLFSVLASGLLLKALQTDRLRYWVMYAAAMLLNFASLIISAYVLAAHVLVAAVALALAYRAGKPLAPAFRRLAAVFTVVGFLAFHLYALILPSVYVRATVAYSDGAQQSGSGSGYFSIFSPDFAGELLRSLTVGIGLGEGPLAAIVILAALVVMAVGYVAMLRHQWALTLALTAPGLANAAFIVISGLTFSPRIFLTLLPLAIIAAVQGVHSLSTIVAGLMSGRMQRALPVAATALAVFLVAAVSLSSLRWYYSVPKQPYRATLEYLETQRQSEDIVIVVDLAEQGYRYYADRMGVRENEGYFVVQTVEELDSLVSAQTSHDRYLVTTLTRFLRSRKPELERRITRDWSILQTFPGSIGNGQITVWVESP